MLTAHKSFASGQVTQHQSTLVRVLGDVFNLAQFLILQIGINYLPPQHKGTRELFLQQVHL